MLYLGLLFRLMVCGFEFYMFSRFMNCVMDYKKNRERYVSYFFGLAITIMFFVNLFERSAWNVIVFYLVSGYLTLFFYNDSLKNKIYFLIIFFFILAGGEFLVSMVLILAEPDTDIQYYSINFMMAVLSAKLLSFLVLQCFIHRVTKKSDMDIPATVLFYLHPVSSILVYIAIFYSDIERKLPYYVNIYLMIACQMLFLSNLVYFGIFTWIKELFRHKRELEIYQLKSEMMESHLEQMKETANDYKRFRHDLIPYLKTVADMIQAGKVTDALEILEEINIKASNPLTYENNYCRDEILNILLTEKAERACSSQINCHIFSEPSFYLENMKHYDMIGIFNNIIDNAIEAAVKCPIESGFIKIELFLSDGEEYAVCRFSNNYVDEPVYHGKFFLTSKKGGDHGLGISIVEGLVNKYSGIYNIQAAEGIFTVTLMFPLISRDTYAL